MFYNNRINILENLYMVKIIWWLFNKNKLSVDMICRKKLIFSRYDRLRNPIFEVLNFA